MAKTGKQGEKLTTKEILGMTEIPHRRYLTHWWRGGLVPQGESVPTENAATRAWDPFWLPRFKRLGELHAKGMDIPAMRCQLAADAAAKYRQLLLLVEAGSLQDMQEENALEVCRRIRYAIDVEYMDILQGEKQ